MTSFSSNFLSIYVSIRSMAPEPPAEPAYPLFMKRIIFVNVKLVVIDSPMKPS